MSAFDWMPRRLVFPNSVWRINCSSLDFRARYDWSEGVLAYRESMDSWLPPTPTNRISLGMDGIPVRTRSASRARPSLPFVARTARRFAPARGVPIAAGHAAFLSWKVFLSQTPMQPYVVATLQKRRITMNDRRRTETIVNGPPRPLEEAKQDETRTRENLLAMIYSLAPST